MVPSLRDGYPSRSLSLPPWLYPGLYSEVFLLSVVILGDKETSGKGLLGPGNFESYSLTVVGGEGGVSLVRRIVKGRVIDHGTMRVWVCENHP